MALPPQATTLQAVEHVAKGIATQLIYSLSEPYGDGIMPTVLPTPTTDDLTVTTPNGTILALEADYDGYTLVVTNLTYPLGNIRYKLGTDPLLIATEFWTEYFTQLGSELAHQAASQ